MNLNPNCCGGHCWFDKGEVRVYPIGAGGNLILCRACWNHENAYNRWRGRETGRPENWPVRNWDEAEVYANAE